MKSIFRQIDDTFVVWFAPANRYMHLQEPAFRVFDDWNRKLPEDRIILNCVEEYQLSLVQARRFVREVIRQLQELVDTASQNHTAVMLSEIRNQSEKEWYSIRNYRINNKIFRFSYSNPELEELIHPGFAYLECQIPENTVDFDFNVFQTGEQLFLQVNNKTCWECQDSKQEYFIGHVFTQLLNQLYQVDDSYWMGAVHASTVAAGNNAVLFTAPSGSGKSTFAAMLMKEGYQVLSDDFSPLSLNPVLVHPFPEGISVKSRSLQVLQPHYPALANSGEVLPDHVREVFIPVSTGKLPQPVPVSAIVFLKYEPTADAELKRISNLQAMDRFLAELWLPPASEVAARFMDWYFQIPCYSLEYSETRRAIQSVEKLF